MGKLKATVRKVGIRASIFLLYLFLGAGIFLGIEKTDELTVQEKKYNASKKTLMQTYNISIEDMKQFSTATEAAVKAGLFKKRYLVEWNFVNAFFFSGNVVTTIGEYMYIF